jgi:uncharacterized protein YukE
MGRRRVPRTFTPPEAKEIAAQFRETAQRVREFASQLRSTGGTLEMSWEGISKNNFFMDFQPEPGNVEQYAAWLESQAGVIESMTVTIWEWA